MFRLTDVEAGAPSARNFCEQAPKNDMRTGSLARLGAGQLSEAGARDRPLEASHFDTLFRATISSTLS